MLLMNVLYSPHVGHSHSPLAAELAAGAHIESASTPKVGQAGFEDVLLANMEKLWGVALNLCRHNQMDADDLVQDAVLRAFKGRASLESADYPFAWLRRTLLNTFLNKQRDEKKWREHEDLTEAENLPSHEDAVSIGEIPSALTHNILLALWDDEILRAVDHLPEEYRLVFLMSDIEEMTREEISEQLNIAMGTVSSRLYRARRKLAGELGGYARARGFSK